MTHGPLRLSLVTLGVANLRRSAQFYEALGLRPSGASQESVIFYQAGAVVISLYERAKLAEDAEVPPEGSGFRGLTLACNVVSEVEVDALLERAVAAGAQLAKPAQRAFWGGYSGYFTDPDGHLWEVARNPFFPLLDGRIELP